jgi:hypothetical protein
MRDGGSLQNQNLRPQSNDNLDDLFLYLFHNQYHYCMLILTMALLYKLFREDDKLKNKVQD